MANPARSLCTENVQNQDATCAGGAHCGLSWRAFAGLQGQAEQSVTISQSRILFPRNNSVTTSNKHADMQHKTIIVATYSIMNLIDMRARGRVYAYVDKCVFVHVKL